MDPTVIFLGKIFLRAVDFKVQATAGINTQTLGTMETQYTYWKMNPWPWRTYLPHSRLDEDHLLHSRCCERSRPPSFCGQKTTVGGEPRVGKENTRDYAMPSAIHSWHIYQTWPEICQVNQNAKLICQTVG